MGESPGVLTGMVICKNEAARIGDCLRSISFCDEIVVIDSGSTDGTLDIIRATPKTRLIERPFVSWNDQKDHGRAESRSRWVLNVDADEVVTDELREEIVETLARVDPKVAGFSIPFRNHFRSAWVRSCGYYPDRHIRLVKKDSARWDTGSVHDRLIVDGEVQELAGHVDHYSFESVTDFIDKSTLYSSAFAKHAHAAGRRSGVWTILAKTCFRFFRAFVLQGGFKEGALGLMIAGLQAYEVFQKYVRLYELERFPEAREGRGDGPG